MNTESRVGKLAFLAKEGRMNRTAVWRPEEELWSCSESTRVSSREHSRERGGQAREALALAEVRASQGGWG